MKVLIDACVIVDVLQRREPFYKAAMDIVLAISNRRCLGVLTAKSVTDVYYILRRNIHNEEEVRKLLRILFTLFDVEDTFSTDCQLALGSPMKDSEDAIMVQAAVRVGLHRDQKFKGLQACRPSRLLTRRIPRKAYRRTYKWRIRLQFPVPPLIHFPYTLPKP